MSYMYGNSFWRIGCIWLFCLLLLWPMLPSLHRKSFDNEEKGKKIMKLSWDITMLKARLGGYSPYRRHTSVSGAEGHGCWPLYVWNWEKISTIWEKQIKRETGFGFALPCTRSVYILFYFIVGLLFIFLFIYLFFYLSIYFFFHSPFMNSGLGSEGNHIVTSHHHPNFPGVPPGAAGRVQWQTKNSNKCLNISRYSITR